MFSARTILGLQLDARAVHAVELTGAAGRRTVRHAATLALTAETTLDAPEGLGDALAAWLRREGFSARHAVIGLPGRWVITREERLPPATGETLRGMLRMASERAFAIPADELVVDCADFAAPPGPGARLLAAIQRKRIEQLQTALRATHLTPLAALPTVCSLAGLLRTPAGAGLLIGAEGVDVAAVRDGRIVLLRHFDAPVGSPNAEELIGAEMRRLSALLPSEGIPTELVLCDQSGEAAGKLDVARWFPNAAVVSLAQRILPGASLGAPLTAAAALASTAAGAYPLDFIHPSLAEAKRSFLAQPRARTGLIAAAALIVIVGALVYDGYRLKSDLSDLRSRTAAVKTEADAARLVVENVAFTRTWRETQAPSLECLRELAQTFPAEGRIWLTNLTLRADGRGVAVGKASDDRAILDELDRLRASRFFSSVNSSSMRGATGGAREVSFAINFTLAGAHKP